MSRPVLLITGGSTGIGAATARAAVADGYRVALTARTEAKFGPLVDELGGGEYALGIAGGFCGADTDSWKKMLLTNVHGVGFPTLTE